MISLGSIMEDIRTAVDHQLGIPASVGMRNAGDEKPCVVIELEGADGLVHLKEAANDWPSLQVRFEIVSATHAEALTTLDALVLTFQSKQNFSGYSLCTTAVSVSARAETPDDGSSDAERIVALRCTFHAMET